MAPSPTKKALHSPKKAIGPLTHSIIGTGTDRHVSVHARPAAEAIVRWTVGEIHLFNIAARREILGSFQHFNNAGAALADPTTVVQVVETFVGVDP